MNKLIFLDFDGVLNTDSYQMQLRAEGRKAYDLDGPLFDPAAVGNLKKITDAVPGVTVMITSTWKLGRDHRWLESLWDRRRMPGNAVLLPDFVPVLSEMELNEETIALLTGKGYEIKNWLDNNAPANLSYVIIDDMDNFLPEQLPFLIQTDPEDGLTDENAQEAIRLLNAHKD